MRPDRCEVLDCGAPAPYQARPRYQDDLLMCAHHAENALSDGCEVLGPTGNVCRIHDDGDIYEVSE